MYGRLQADNFFVTSLSNAAVVKKNPAEGEDIIPLQSAPNIADGKFFYVIFKPDKPLERIVQRVYMDGGVCKYKGYDVEADYTLAQYDIVSLNDLAENFNYLFNDVDDLGNVVVKNGLTILVYGGKVLGDGIVYDVDDTTLTVTDNDVTYIVYNRTNHDIETAAEIDLYEHYVFAVITAAGGEITSIVKERPFNAGENFSISYFTRNYDGQWVVNQNAFIKNEAFGPAWETDLNGATKNALYNKLSTMDGAIESKASSADIPTSTSDLTNDSGFVSSSNTGSTGQVLIKTPEGAKWDANTGAAWGSVSGNISSQTDLKNALDAKASSNEIKDGTLVIKQGGVAKGTFSANASNNTEVDLTLGDMEYGDFSFAPKSGTSFKLGLSSTIEPDDDFTINAPDTIKDGQTYILRVTSGATIYHMYLGTNITNPNSVSTTLTINGTDTFVFLAIGGKLELQPAYDLNASGGGDMKYSDFYMHTQTGPIIEAGFNVVYSATGDFRIDAPATIVQGQTYTVRVVNLTNTNYNISLGSNISNPYHVILKAYANQTMQLVFYAYTSGRLELQPTAITTVEALQMARTYTMPVVGESILQALDFYYESGGTSISFTTYQRVYYVTKFASTTSGGSFTAISATAEGIDYKVITYNGQGTVTNITSGTL